MSRLPTGTVTFLFTDIEGSTALLQQLPDDYGSAMMECRRLVRAAVQERGGHEVGTQGDAVFGAFASAHEALLGAIAAQRAVLRHPWPDGAVMKVRMGLHTGEARVEEGDYVGLDVHRAARICAAAHGGQILLSDTVAALVTKDLPDGLTLHDVGQHRLKDLSHPLRLFQVFTPDLPADFPSVRSLGAHSHNLPVLLTSFIGREREITEVKRLLGVSRLMTLTGSGGAGKTRLALKVAAEVVEGYPDGVWLVELGVLSDPSLVPKAVASALGLPEQPGRSLIETLTNGLRAKSLLVILDNCEHLVAACAHLSDALLRTCSSMRILATSREALGVNGEITWRVPSLSVPDPQRLPPLDHFTEYEAVRLFVDRAVASAPQFAVTSSNAPAIAQVCHRLDGIPLAIELAAARVKVLAVEQIAARLDDQFRLLTGGSRTALPRQQTLRAAIDWSYDLLSGKERTVLRRLSVFSGGWSLEAAEAICTAATASSEVLDSLTRLVDKSLVIVDVDANRGEARYRLLETVRQYGWNRLVESGEAHDVQHRHRDWYLDLAERANTLFGRPEETLLYKRFEAEHDNLRAALKWSLEEQGSVGAALRMASALGPFWHNHSHYAEGRQWLGRVLAQSGGAVSSARGRALDYAAVLAWRQGDYEEAAAFSEESITVLQRLAATPRLADAYRHRGLVSLRQGEFAVATVCFDKSLALARQCGEKWLIAHALLALATVARYGGNYDKAWALSQEGVTLAREMAGKRAIAYATRLAGDVARSRADLLSAVRLYNESLALYQEAEDKWIAQDCLEGLAAVAAVLGEYRRAVHLFATAVAIRETLGLTLAPFDQSIHDTDVTAASEALGVAAFTAAWAGGRAMTLEQAIEYALAGESI